MLSVKEAMERIMARVPAPATESIPIGEAAGRILAAPARSRRRLPPWDNSAMDGFAVCSADLPGTLEVAGTIAAGDRPGAKLSPGTVLRIMTGAPVPAGADAVVMREEVDDLGERAVFSKPAEPGQHLRRAGEDVAEGDLVLEAGDRLGAGEIGLLAALGFAEVAVARRPRAAILSAGDELVDVDVEPAPGKIVNSNGYALAAQVREAGGVPVELGIVGDDLAALTARVRDGLACDLLLTSGGVSVGDFDFMKQAFSDAGVTMDFWKVAVKPGKPLAFGVAETGALVFGLPGNPVSSMVSFELFARPAILALQGARGRSRPRVPVVVSSPIAKRPGRSHYLRAQLRRRGRRLEATPHPRQGSGMLSSMAGVDALLEIDRDLGDLEAGAEVPALLLRPV